MPDYSKFFNIPKGKEDKPILIYDPTKPIIYDINDIDGAFFMLERDFGGCIYIAFSKCVLPETGKVTLNGRNVHFVVKELVFAKGVQFLGIRLRGHLSEYGSQEKLLIQGFVDTDGNEMDPVELAIKTVEKTEPLAEYAFHESIALQAAEEGIVLLKNDNHALPLTGNETLNVFGKGMWEFRSCAVGAGKTNQRYTVGLREAILKDEGFTLNAEVADCYRGGEDIIPSAPILKKARESSELAVMVISRASGENYDNSSDKGEFYLSEDEKRLLQILAATFTKTIVILNVGYPIETAFIEELGVDAVLYTGFGGMLGGQAVVNVLKGKVNPSGKLTDTWARYYEDIPASRNFYDCAGGKVRLDSEHDIWLDTVYEEDIYVGYRYFETFGKNPGFPFGYGLSYTTFQLEITKYSYDKSQGVSLAVEVRNTGEASGKETVQVYVKKPDGKLEKPLFELVEFEKTKELLPGESEVIWMSIPKCNMTSYDEERAAYVMEKGVYEIFVGTHVQALSPAGNFILNETEVIKQVTNRMVPVNKLKTLSKFNPEATWPFGTASGIKEAIHAFEPIRQQTEYPVLFAPCKTKDRKITFTQVQQDESLLDEMISGMTVEELARLAICLGDGWGMEGTGEAGRIAQPEGYELPEFIVSDGNSGVNMKKPNIGLPSGATICASFNKKLAEQIGQVIGEEAKGLNISLILAPALNIHRNPLNGRQPEYFSEDPYLAGKMAGCYCRGLESTGIGGCYKHCIGNNAESSRKRNQSIMTERAIREIYFKAFEVAMTEHMPVSIMTGYNAVNGLHTAIDADLILGLFREENGFNGFVMTDWNSYDTADIADMEAAGNTWLTPGSADDKFTCQLVEAVNIGKLDINRLRENIRYLLKMMLKLSSSKTEKA